MRLDLKKVLNDWRNDKYKIGLRRVTYVNYPGREGEYVITLSEFLNVTLDGKNKDILVQKKFQTFAQADHGQNPEGDVIRAQQIIEQVNREFSERNENAINELFSDFEGESEELE